MKTKVRGGKPTGAALDEKQLLEELANLEHQQWTKWSRTVAERVDTETRARWENYWIPYEQLSEETKEQDRIWARRILKALQKSIRAAKTGRKP